MSISILLAQVVLAPATHATVLPFEMQRIRSRAEIHVPSMDDEELAALKEWQAYRTRVSPGMVQDRDVAQPANDGGLWVNFDAYAWLTAVDGDIGVNGIVAETSANMGDVWDDSDTPVVPNVRLEIGVGALGFFVEGLYADITANDARGPFGFESVDVRFEQRMLDFGLMLKLGEWEPTGEAARNRRNNEVYLYGGGRYHDIEAEIDPVIGTTQRDTEEWLDPIVGAKLVMPFAANWHFQARGDVGGFGVESDFTWSALAAIGLDFHIFELPASIFAGYRALGTDYTDGSGTDEFTWDVVQHGPVLGLSIYF